MSTNNSSSRGMGLVEVLTLIFIVLKLFGLIDWNWILVFSPVLISLALGFLLLFIVKILGR